MMKSAGAASLSVTSSKSPAFMGSVLGSNMVIKVYVVIAITMISS